MSLNVSSIRRRCGLRRRISLRRRRRRRQRQRPRRLGPVLRQGIARRIVCRGISTCRRCRTRRRMRRVGARASRVLFHFPCFFLSLFFMARYGALRFSLMSTAITQRTSPLLVLHHTSQMRFHIIYTVLTYFKTNGSRKRAML